jgi:hypothetical protein
VKFGVPSVPSFVVGVRKERVAHARIAAGGDGQQQLGCAVRRKVGGREEEAARVAVEHAAGVEKGV